MKNIFLCGFMGCGKSTVGKSLAIRLNTSFIDMDQYIENSAGQSVSDIFKNFGEKHFRNLEEKVAAELSARSGIIVATGGGAVLSKVNVASFKSNGIILLIDVPLPVISSRLTGDNTRPLLQKPDKAKVLQDLYQKRMPLYRAAADFVVTNDDNRSEDKMAEEIIRLLNLRFN